MDFKKTKLAVASLMIASLAACSTNKSNVDDNTLGPRNVSTGDRNTLNNRNVSTLDMDRVNMRNVTHGDQGWTYDGNMSTNNRDWVNTRSMSTGDRDWVNTDNRNGSNNKKATTQNSISTTEIQPMNNGFITIDQNSYSTGTPSHQFPHSQLVQQGNYWYYTFVPETGQRGTNMPQQPGQKYSPTTPATPTPRTVTPRTTTPAPRTTAPAPSQQPSTQAPVGISQMAQQVIDLTNNERKKNGLAPLKADTSLSKVAQTKSNDMETKHYFSHTSPTYGSPFDMMRDFGVTYKSAGENIAMGQTTAQQVVTAWMNSEGHRKNILSASYTNIGVGFTSKGNYWSQMFIGK